MIVTRKSPFDQKVREWDLPITQDQMVRYVNGDLVQNAFPHLDSNQREFIMTGITPNQWEETFGGKLETSDEEFGIRIVGTK